MSEQNIKYVVDQEQLTALGDEIRRLLDIPTPGPSEKPLVDSYPVSWDKLCSSTEFQGIIEDVYQKGIALGLEVWSLPRKLINKHLTSLAPEMFMDAVTDNNGSTTRYPSQITYLECPNVKTCAPWAFNMCPYVKVIKLDNCESLGLGACDSNSDLTEIYIPKVKTIGQVCFAYNNLNYCPNIELPSIENIGSRAFWQTGLRKIILGSQEINQSIIIQQEAFKNSPLFLCVIMSNTLPILQDINVFEGTPISGSIHSGAIILVPAGTRQNYINAENWSNFSDFIKEFDLNDLYHFYIDNQEYKTHQPFSTWAEWVDYGINNITNFEFILQNGTIYNKNTGTIVLGHVDDGTMMYSAMPDEYIIPDFKYQCRKQ